MQINKRENMNVNSLVDRGRQVGKCLCDLQQNMLFLIKSNSKCLS